MVFFLLTFLGSDLAWPESDWLIRKPGEVGLNPASIESMLAAVKAGEHGALHSVLLVKNGYLVAEAYVPADPRLPEQIGSGSGPHQMQSATKSLLSLLVGAAVHQGLLKPGDRLSKHLSRRMEIRTDGWDPRLTDLLTMRGGLAWQQWSRQPRHERDHVRLLAEADWIGYILSRPAASEQPGTTFVYADANPILLAATLGAAAGKPLEHFARETLFKPLGITSAQWQLRDRQNLVHTGAGLAMTSRDAARLGLLLARGGVWKSRRLIDSTYLAQATRIQVAKPFSNREGLRAKVGFGYLWWLYQDEQGIIPLALGMGEQGILVDPKRDLVLVTTGWIQNPQHALKVLQLYLLYLKNA